MISLGEQSYLWVQGHHRQGGREHEAGCQWENQGHMRVTHVHGASHSREEQEEHSVGEAPQGQSCAPCREGWERGVAWARSRRPLQERTVRVTVPFVRFRMATASSWVTPSRLCPLTAMIWSPLFRRPSSEAAPCKYKVGLLTSQKMLPHRLTTEQELGKNVGKPAGPPGSPRSRSAPQPRSNHEHTQRRPFSNGFSNGIPIWERI